MSDEIKIPPNVMYLTGEAAKKAATDLHRTGDVGLRQISDVVSSAVCQVIARWMREECAKVMKDRADAAFDNMEGCDHDEFLRWEATFVSCKDSLEQIRKVGTQ